MLKKSLVLRKETIRSLGDREMQDHQGGISPVASFVSGVIASHYLEKGLDAFDQWATIDNCPPPPPPKPPVVPRTCPGHLQGLFTLFQ